MSVEEEATGVRNAHGYRDYANSLGYKLVEVLNWTSSAGDWEFLVSKDGSEWRILSQTNNYPMAGFSYHISDEVFPGPLEQAIKLVEELYV